MTLRVTQTARQTVGTFAGALRATQTTRQIVGTFAGTLRVTQATAQIVRSIEDAPSDPVPPPAARRRVVNISV